MEWMLMPLKRYADFQGRSRRMEFWMWVLFTLIVGLVLGIVDGIVGLRLGGAPTATPGMPAGLALFSSMGILGLIWSLATLVPNLAVAVRRLHDTNRSGFWLLLPIAPYAIGLVLMAVAVASQNFGLIGIAGILTLIGLICAIVLLVFYCLPGTPGPNKYGPDPIGSNPATLSETFQ
jgi:uncharacterized membrane protein YhaH (DUF805 family)